VKTFFIYFLPKKWFSFFLNVTIIFLP
jgi:hypothetical protein